MPDDIPGAPSVPKFQTVRLDIPGIPQHYDNLPLFLMLLSTTQANLAWPSSVGKCHE